MRCVTSRTKSTPSISKSNPSLIPKHLQVKPQSHPEAPLRHHGPEPHRAHPRGQHPRRPSLGGCRRSRELLQREGERWKGGGGLAGSGHWIDVSRQQHRGTQQLRPHQDPWLPRIPGGAQAGQQEVHPRP